MRTRSTRSTVMLPHSAGDWHPSKAAPDRGREDPPAHGSALGYPRTDCCGMGLTGVKTVTRSEGAFAEPSVDALYNWPRFCPSQT
jgi:hypothetical protein